MKERVGETWQENDKIFVVVGSPTSHDLWVRHPVRYLDDNGVKAIDDRYVDEGAISWEAQPYMTRLV